MFRSIYRDLRVRAIRRITFGILAAILWTDLKFTPQLAAQVLYGSLVGNVTDASTASVPGVSVRITQQETNQSRESDTNELGTFTFPTLPSGTYTVTFTKNGFQSTTRTGVVISTNAVARLDVALQVGAVTESVSVSTQASLLQTDRADVRAEVDTVTLQNVPVPTGRNFQNLFVTIPGFTPPANAFPVPTNPSRALLVSVNGASTTSVNTKIDGATVTNVWLPHIAAYVPPLESIDTVNVVTNSFDAEQGLAGGGAVNVQIKSGTNAVHGSAFEYHTNHQLKAKPFFLPAGERKPKKVYNQFGGTVGGPIRKDKLFYFLSYEGTLDHQLATQLLTLPSSLVRMGNFTQSANLIYDPATGDADGAARAPFPGNFIPASRIDSIAQKIIDRTPQPTFASLLQSNYYASGPYTFDRHTADAKVNWNPTNKLSTSVRFSVLNFHMLNAQAFGEQLGGVQLSTAGGQPNGWGDTYSNTISAVYTFQPNFIVDGYFGYTRMDYNVVPVGSGKNIGLEVFGIPGTNGTTDPESGFPVFNVSGYTVMGNPADNYPIYNTDPQYTYAANANWTKGSHNVRFGFAIDRQHMNHIEPRGAGGGGGAQGVFNFTGGTTALRGGAAPNQFNSYAEFLLGLANQITKSHPTQTMTSRMWANSLYVRDQWQVTRRLTFTYGTRWEYFPMGTRVDRGMERYDLNTNKMLICGVGQVPTDCGVQMSKRYFAPRLGIAYRASSGFVIRAGYGITYDPFSVVRNLLQNYPIVQALILNAPSTFQAAGSLKTGIPPVPSVDLGNGVIDLPLSYGVVTLPDKYVRGYVQSWNLTLQKELKWGFVGQAGYVATRQIRTGGRYNVNYGLPGGGVASQPLFQKFGRSAGTSVIQPWQHTNYDSLQTKLDRRFSQGFQLTTSYTFSKIMGLCCDNSSDAGPQILIPEYLKLNRAVMPTDRTHVFTASGVADLPFGRGKKYASTGWAASLFSGWQVNALFAAYSGTPFSVTASAASLNAPGNNQRADLVKPTVAKLGGIGPTSAYFDPLAFKSVTEPRFGTAGFDLLRGPGLVNLDLGIFREFRFTENVGLQFRAEAFNFTNTPHFNNPGANVSNMQLNSDGSVRDLGGFATVTSTSGIGREGIDERVFRFGLRLGW
jgi:hypothetical protein